jgi:hypothetical protein
VHFYCIISDTSKCAFIYITLFHNIAIPDMFRRLSRHLHQGLYLGLHIKSICFFVGVNKISRMHYQENGYTNVWLCGKIAQCKNIERCIYITVICVVIFKKNLKSSCILLELVHCVAFTITSHWLNFTLYVYITLQNDVQFSLKIIVAIIGVCIIVCRFVYFI